MIWICCLLIDHLVKRFLSALLVFLFIVGCKSSDNLSSCEAGPGCEYASYFGIITDQDDSLKVRGVVTISPSGSSVDTLLVDSPLKRIVCMSTSGVAALSAVGADSLIVAVSGLKYITDERLRARADAGLVEDVGYDSSLDYEKIMRLKPDLIVAYLVGEVESPYLAKLKTLGMPLMIVSDHLEQHPLARAEYVKLFGALTGRLNEARDFFDNVRDRYISLSAEGSETDQDKDGSDAGLPVKVLMNIPYADAWYIPGVDNYMSRLVRDAGGVVLGAAEGSASGVVTIEKAYRLSQRADMWLCPGHCTTIGQLESIHHLFPHFRPLAERLPIYNNVLRTNSAGGNDFWESGAMRPDLILDDLRHIFHDSSDNLHYFMRLQ